MLPIAAPLMSIIRIGGGADRESCLVCSAAIRASDEAMSVPGGGHVHRGCATYRMRRHARMVRRIGSI